MLLTITTTYQPATDLGHLLHKNPARFQSFDLNFGRAHVFYPEASPEKCTAVLLLDIDPVALVRGKSGSESERANRPLQPYVNDRPYVASSFLSVALAQVYSSALSGKSKSYPELVETKLPLSAHLGAVPARGGETILRRLFEPLGYTVTVEPAPLDVKFPEWGQSAYYSLTLEGTFRLKDLLSHLYVLVPVLDEEKHYWFGDDEVDKLLRHGEGWLAAHPEKNLIARRYLKRPRLTRDALDRLVEVEDTGLTEPETGDPIGLSEPKTGSGEEALEEKVSLNEQRLAAVVTVLKQNAVKQVLDLGCGEGKLLKTLLADSSFTRLTGMDVSYRVLEKAKVRLHLDSLPSFQQSRLTLLQGSLTYRDKRLAGYEAATVIEVIEHLDLARLASFERILFEFARPGIVVVTTPNVEYNVLFEGLPAGKLRHPDHRFEWSRARFQEWAGDVAARFGYRVEFLPVGPVDPNYGPPTQMAVFKR
ncbi:MAG: 3' terminal RNA ribose 2'-O-methyltransferase Hen1 [Chloroflexi bacterium]|mgnify:CR=1 FL=1|nr:3' terminal RNA ribose 2'-O-methyltransferase Hen1 [Chloroflexota bacterium]OJV92563.1 MAG: 3' terminal RNA ribose 2'-O-methyltransferase Hen1 [Chloroflexi bacterium 54-19]